MVAAERGKGGKSDNGSVKERYDPLLLNNTRENGKRKGGYKGKFDRPGKILCVYLNVLNYIFGGENTKRAK